MNAPVDVEGKGRPGVVSVDWFSKSVYYYRNTLGEPGDWPETKVDTSDNYECGDLVDLEGKGKAKILLTHTRETVWYEVGVKDGKPGLDQARGLGEEDGVRRRRGRHQRRRPARHHPPQRLVRGPRRHPQRRVERASARRWATRTAASPTRRRSSSTTSTATA